MSVPDKQLPWWEPENEPDGVHCDRNGCSNDATVSVVWRTLEGENRACRYHGEWWTARTGGLMRIR